MKKKTFTKDQLVRAVAKEFDCTIKDARGMVETVFKTIITEVDNGRRVELRGFGVFSHKMSPAVKKYNRPLRKMSKTRPRLNVRFKPSTRFLGIINGV